MWKRFLTRRSFYLFEILRIHTVPYLVFVCTIERAVYTDVGRHLIAPNPLSRLFFRIVSLWNWELGKLCCGIAWHHSYHSSVRSVQTLFSSHLEYHRIGLQILEVSLVAHSFWLRWIQVLTTAGRSAFNLHLDCGLRIELPSQCYLNSTTGKVVEIESLFLGNSRFCGVAHWQSVAIYGNYFHRLYPYD
jgi:hypothetical protein